MDNQAPKKQNQEKKALRTAEKRAVNKIVVWVVGVAAALVIIVGLMGYRYVHMSLQPVDSKADQPIAVTIPIGSTTKQIGAQLEKHKVIKSATVFNYYLKFHNFDASSFKAGTYTFTQADTLDDITTVLRGGSSEGNALGSVLVKEGVQIDDIASVVQEMHSQNKSYSRAKFLALMKNQKFFDKLEKRYPKLLSSAAKAKGVRYRLEGYLFPATYSVNAGESLEELVTAMVAKTDSVMRPYYKSIHSQGYTVQHVMTLASLVEREGVSEIDRRTIAGVFLNRLAVHMPLQSDISVMYALNTHKTHLTNKDTSVKSPYNLYKNRGYGPGPFNSPSEISIRAVLGPAERNKHYLYFVANLKTGQILYAATRQQHDINTQKFASDNGK